VQLFTRPLTVVEFAVQLEDATVVYLSSVKIHPTEPLNSVVDTPALRACIAS